MSTPSPHRTGAARAVAALIAVCLMLTAAACSSGSGRTSRAPERRGAVREPSRPDDGEGEAEGEDVATAGPEHGPDLTVNGAVRTGELRGDLRTRSWARPRSKEVRRELKAPNLRTSGTSGKEIGRAHV